MKLLLDENLPKRLKLDFTEFEIFTTADLGWTGVTNGRLLELLIENDFNVLLTFDKNLQYQQNFTRYSIAVLVIEASDNRYQTLKNLIPTIKQVLTQELKPGPTIVRKQG